MSLEELRKRIDEIDVQLLNLLNERGDPKIFETRYSLIWAKVGGRWQIVDQHVSRLPSNPK